MLRGGKSVFSEDKSSKFSLKKNNQPKPTTKKTTNQTNQNQIKICRTYQTTWLPACQRTRKHKWLNSCVRLVILLNIHQHKICPLSVFPNQLIINTADTHQELRKEQAPFHSLLLRIRSRDNEDMSEDNQTCNAYLQ